MNHSHYLYDSDPHFKIDPISRKITNESSNKTTIIQHDHNSERFTFEVPRYIEGHDLSLCNVVEIHYVNIESNTKIIKAGVYSVDDLRIKEGDDDTVVCSWLVSNNATQLVGQLQFLVRFSCVSDTTGTVEYVWNTAVYNSINISNGIYNSESSSDNPVPAFNFVTTIGGQVLKFFVGTKAEYDTLTFEQKENLFAILTDDTTKDDLFQRMDEIDADNAKLTTEVNKVNNDVNDIVSGETIVPEATHAVSADKVSCLGSKVDAVGHRIPIVRTGVWLCILQSVDLTKYRTDIIVVADLNANGTGTATLEEWGVTYSATIPNVDKGIYAVNQNEYTIKYAILIAEA